MSSIFEQDDPESKPDIPGLDEEQEAFRDVIRETFEPHLKSKQAHDIDGVYVSAVKDSHNDGEDIKRSFKLEPFADFLERTARLKHPIAQHPQALAHLVTHIKQWEKHELGSEDPDFEGLPRDRRKVFDWFLAKDIDDPAERQSVSDTRRKKLRDGGTGIIMHGEQGTTKTTGIYWLVANTMHVNQDENVIWQASLDDTEWQVFGSWATLCLPEGVEVEMTANPYDREFRHVGEFPIHPKDIVRDVTRYEDPEDLLSKMAERRPGQVYVVYPDPHFRKCQSLTTWNYDSMWEVDESSKATPVNHFWFGLMEALVHGSEYNDSTTLVADEAHKWLRQGVADDEHNWWKKIDDWATYWVDARKKRLSCILAVQKWRMLHNKVKDVVRWGATMNDEKFPNAAPIGGKNSWNQDLGDLCVWNSNKWNHTGYPDLKRHFSVTADIDVSYPGFEAVKQAKS